METTAKIGLSFSACLRDILDKKVDVNEVICIISGTKFENMDAESIIDYYTRDHYWPWCNYTAEQVIEVLNVILPRVIQPREWGITVNIAHGYWLDQNIC